MKLAESLFSADVSDPQVILDSRDLTEPELGFTEVEVKVPNVKQQINQLDKLVTQIDHCSTSNLKLTSSSINLKK